MRDVYKLDLPNGDFAKTCAQDPRTVPPTLHSTWTAAGLRMDHLWCGGFLCRNIASPTPHSGFYAECWCSSPLEARLRAPGRSASLELCHYEASNLPCGTVFSPVKCFLARWPPKASKLLCGTAFPACQMLVGSLYPPSHQNCVFMRLGSCRVAC